MSKKAKFMKNYSGILNPEVAYAEAQAHKEVAAGKFKDATYSPSANRQLERDYIKNARMKAGSRV